MGTVSNVKIEPMVVTWGTDTAQVSTIVCRADAAKDLQNDYFFFYTPAGVGHYAWFNVNSEGADPVIAGFTQHAVAIATGATANAVASALQAVLTAVTGFDATVDTSTVTLTNTDNGYAQGPHEGIGTNFTFEVTTQGNTAADIGFIDGDIEITGINPEKVAITAHEFGVNTLGHIRSGRSEVSVAMTLKETSSAQLKKVLNQDGGAFTPAGASGTEVVGVGTHKDFTQTLVQSDKLVLHPKVLGYSDHSRDFTFHLCALDTEGLTFSGESIFMIPIKFVVYPKLTLNDRVEYFCFGNGTQTLT